MRQWRGRVFNTSSKPVEPRGLRDRHTAFKWPVPERSEDVKLVAVLLMGGSSVKLKASVSCLLESHL